MINNLKKVRTAAGLSTQEVAVRAGSSRNYMNQLQQQSGPVPGLLMAYKIAKVLSTTVYDICPDNLQVVEETIIVVRVIE